MLVGEAPSSTDDSTGRPFTGPAGRLLDELLAEHGLHRRDLWLTNLVRCYAGRIRDGRPENRPVKAGELAACATWLEQELLFINPRVILAVGAPAAKALIAKDFKLQEQRGAVFGRGSGPSIKSTGRGLHCCIHLFLGRLGNFNDGLAGRRIEDLLGISLADRELSLDQELGLHVSLVD